MNHNDKAERAARRRVLETLRKETLVQMHVRNGGIMGVGTYKKWTKEELINAVLEDEFDRAKVH